MPLFKITFTDGSTFTGGDNIYKSKWDEIPDKEILCLEYFLSDGSSLILKSFEAYACFVEATMDVIGASRHRLENKYVMGLIDGKVTSYRIALNGVKGSTKYVEGDITKREYPIGTEFRGRPVGKHVWKKGIKEG